MMEMLPQTDQQHHFQLRHQVVLPVLEHAKLHPFLLKAQIVNKDSHIVREVESYPVHKVVVPLIVVLVVVELEDIDHLIMLLLVWRHLVVLHHVIVVPQIKFVMQQIIYKMILGSRDSVFPLVCIFYIFSFKKIDNFFFDWFQKVFILKKNI